MSIESIVHAFLERNQLKLLSTHFLSHIEELDPDCLEFALSYMERLNFPMGQTEIYLGDQASPNLKTRLWGEKMGDTLDLESETFIFKSRGEGRPPQKLLVREEPLRSTQTLTVELREGGLYTIFAGPSMPYPDNDPEGHWERNFLAFPPEQ